MGKFLRRIKQYYNTILQGCRENGLDKYEDIDFDDDSQMGFKKDQYEI